MKRRNFLIALGVVPTLALEACSKNSVLPNTPTIVIGKVIDENAMPVSGWGFSFVGYDGTKIPNVNTFAKDTQTDKDGIYKYSIVIPQETTYISLGVIGFIENGALNSQKNNLYIVYFERDGKYIQFNGSEPNPTPIIGESNTINFQIRKK